jgi:hypothetical protein
LTRTYTDNELEQTFAEVKTKAIPKQGVIEIEPEEEEETPIQKEGHQVKTKRKLRRERISPEVEIVPTYIFS